MTTVDKFWVRFWIGKNGLCVLCEDNSGSVMCSDGIKRPCFCPNGRAIQNEKDNQSGQ